jgi:polysaccharide biosynthesis transport protein
VDVTDSNLKITTENEPGYGQLFAVLLRRRFWLLGILSSVVGLAFVMTKLQEPTYVSTMQLLVEPNYQGKENQNPAQPRLEEQFADSNIQVDSATQISLMKSSELLRKAMSSLNRQYPEIDPDDPESVTNFKAALSVTQIVSLSGSEKETTKIFEVTYTANDPKQTQAVLKTMQQVYLDYNLEQQKARLSKGLEFIDQQLPQVRSQVEQSENALEQFRSGQELIDPEIQAKAQAEALGRIQEELRTNLAQIEELQDRYESLQAQIGLAPQDAVVAARLNQSPRYQALLDEVQKTELALVQQQLLFNDNTAEVQVLLEQRQEQLGLLQNEVRQIAGDSAASVEQLGELDITLINNLVDAEVNLRALKARNESLVNSEQQLRNDLQRFPSLLAEYGRLQPEIELNRETLKQLLAARQELGLEIARGGFDWQIVEKPQLGIKTGPSLTQNLLLGIVVGVLLGGVAAFVRESVDDSVHDADELKRHTALPMLGMLPKLPLETPSPKFPVALPFSRSESRSSPNQQLIYWQPFREACDLLYKNIQLLDASRSLKSLVITSVLPGEGKSTIALGLAISAARLHQRVLLVDANLRSPNLHQLLNLPNEQGLSNLLNSRDSLSSQIGSQDTESHSNISVLTAGPAVPDPVKLLSSQRMQEAIATFESSYDLVIVDAPCVLGTVDPILTGSYCDGIILVGRVDQVSRSKVRQAITMLNKLNVIGVVANGLDLEVENVYYPAAQNDLSDSRAASNV